MSQYYDKVLTYAQPVTFGEVAFMLWLVIKGATQPPLDVRRIMVGGWLGPLGKTAPFEIPNTKGLIHAPLLTCGCEYLPVCGSGFALWASPQAEAALLGTDFFEIDWPPIVRTPEARDYLLFDMTCLWRGNKVSFCAAVPH